MPVMRIQEPKLPSKPDGEETPVTPFKSRFKTEVEERRDDLYAMAQRMLDGDKGR